MSADLFAAFGDSQPQSSQPRPPEHATSTSSDLFTVPTVLSTQTSTPATSQSQLWPGLRPLNDALPRPSGVGPQKGDNYADDDWGEFEMPQPSPKPAQRAVSSVAVGMGAAPPRPQSSWEAPRPQRTRIVRAPTIELMTNSLIDLPGTNDLPEDVRSPPWARKSFVPTQQAAPKVASQKKRPEDIKVDPNVLFDADDFAGDNDGEDDDFGEFVASPSQPPPDLVSGNLFNPSTAAKPSSSQLTSITSTGKPSSPYPQAPISPAFQERNPFPGLAVQMPAESKMQQDVGSRQSPVTAWPSLEPDSAGSHHVPPNDKRDASKNDVGETKPAQDVEPAINDDWNWDSEPAAKTGESQETDTQWNWDSVIPQEAGSSQLNGEAGPPTNVPPPAILLSMFPQLLEQANTSLFKPIGGHPFSIKNRILSDPKTVEFLRGYLALATVGARLIAGRKLRWHRDKFLAKGMSISTAGSKGMKLAGIDKTQATREDREASDVLDVWKENVGRLRSAVGAANSTIHDQSQQLKIPELRESMPVQTARTVPTAPKACVVCGIKRDERIPRVDINVEDVFDEWWTKHWGHTTCKRFWVQHENELRQR